MNSEKKTNWTFRLIVAEKPSVARTIAEVIGDMKPNDPKEPRYLFNDEWMVSWCVGHLVELAMPQDYDRRYERWQGEDLPILPHPWQYSVTKKTREQYEMLAFLMTHHRVAEVICATDAGREGELIFRLVYNQCGCRKPVKRLWISSLEESAIREGMNHLRDSKDFDLLYEAALCRQKADWLVGINASRLFSLVYSQTLNIGRVMTPTLSLVAEREKAIEVFRPEKFYTVQLSCGFPAVSERLESQEEAKRIAAACSMKEAHVLKVERREKKEKPPKLYDLTTLQRDANRIFGFTAQQTLDYAQALYEKKLITYPRTDSQYLTEEMAESTESLVPFVANCFPYISGMAITTDIRQVINSNKVSDHHAIIPTKVMPTLPWGDIPAQEKVLLSLICNRLICATSTPHEYSETEVLVECEGHRFTGKGKTVTQIGWKLPYELFMNSLKQDKEEKPQQERTYNIQDVFEGKRIYPCLSSVKEGETTPQKHYTEDSLLAAMESAGAEEMPEDAERKGLGTPATRAGILEKLVQAKLLVRQGAGKQRNLLPTDKGKTLIAVLPEILKSPQMTAEWEQRLKAIEHGEGSSQAFLNQIEKMIRSLMEMVKPEEAGNKFFPSAQAQVGPCPVCGAPVIERQKGFFCENRLCHFAIWKDNRFFTSKRKTVSRELISALLENRQVKADDLFSQKSGKTYSAIIMLETDKEGHARFKLICPEKDQGTQGVMTP